MAVISVRRSRQSPELTIDKSGLPVIKVAWEVESNDPTDGVRVIYLGAQATSFGANAVPRWGSTYAWPGEAANGLFLFEYSVKRRHDDRNRNLWTIEGTYSTPDPGQDPEQDPEDPSTFPTKYRMEHVTFTEVVEEDRLGLPIVNSAGQEFDEPLEQEQSRLVLIAEKVFISSLPASGLGLDALNEILELNKDYKHTVNDAPYKTAGPREWFCHSIGSSDLQTGTNGVLYYTAIFRLELNTRTWDRKVLDRGFKHHAGPLDLTLVQATADMTREDGSVIKVPTNEPVLLDGNGRRLADGVPGVFLSFRVREETDFDGLGI